MPAIRIDGFRKDTEGSLLLKLRSEIQEIANHIPEMEIEPKHISPYFPASVLADHNLPQELIVTIEGLFKTPKRTEEVIGTFCRMVGEVVQKNMSTQSQPEDFFIEVVAWSLEDRTRYWSTSKK